MRREVPVLVGGIGGTLLGAVAFFVIGRPQASFYNDDMSVLYPLATALLGCILGVAIGMIAGLFLR